MWIMYRSYFFSSQNLFGDHFLQIKAAWSRCVRSMLDTNVLIQALLPGPLCSQLCALSLTRVFFLSSSRMCHVVSQMQRYDRERWSFFFFYHGVTEKSKPDVVVLFVLPALLYRESKALVPFLLHIPSLYKHTPLTSPEAWISLLTRLNFLNLWTVLHCNVSWTATQTASTLRVVTRGHDRAHRSRFKPGGETAN